jgi:hypothetical protein
MLVGTRHFVAIVSLTLAIEAVAQPPTLEIAKVERFASADFIGCDALSLCW